MVYKMEREPWEVNKIKSCQGHKNLDSQRDVEWESDS
jgi:hypothetical protein